MGRNKEKDKLIKYFKENNITYTEESNKIETEIVFKDKNISLYPYFKVEEDYFSIIINIRKLTEKLNLDLYQKINSFNLVSQFFVAKISNENILYLEYNTLYTDNLRDIFESSISSLNELLSFIEAI